MKRVASELDALSGPEKEPNREFFILQGVRFAFRVHQVCFISVSVSSNLYLKHKESKTFRNVNNKEVENCDNYGNEILNRNWSQFAGGFDAESMKAFEELRSRVKTKTSEDSKLET